MKKNVADKRIEHKSNSSVLIFPQFFLLDALGSQQAEHYSGEICQNKRRVFAASSVRRWVMNRGNLKVAQMADISNMLVGK